MFSQKKQIMGKGIRIPFIPEKATLWQEIILRLRNVKTPFRQVPYHPGQRFPLQGYLHPYLYKEALDPYSDQSCQNKYLLKQSLERKCFKRDFDKRGGQKSLKDSIKGVLVNRGRKLIFEMKKFTMIYSRTIIDKASR